MLFNSIEFLFLFLPTILFVFFWLGSHNTKLAAIWLTLGSLFFYGWWSPVYLWLLLASIIFNYLFGYALARGDDIGSTRRTRLLTLAVTSNLLLLGYFKYANFFTETVNSTIGTSYNFAEIALPLGISFFTFTQIAFLVDAACGKAKEFNFIHYTLFVTYFPHLIAGPVLHHKEMMPQFSQKSTYRVSKEFITVGLTIFALGLFKKVVLADGVAPYATPLFTAAELGDSISLFQAWGGALAYTLQLYFDFSGYCDMAIGLSYMIGIRLPLNFNSPYKAANIADFWRRWHMTLSRFLRDYLYIPLGGNRYGVSRRYVNLMATMLLGGLWHGAGWTFVIWGGLHGAYLVIHQTWRAFLAKCGFTVKINPAIGHPIGVGVTFIAVVVGWVFFRSQTVDGAISILRGMIGLNGISLPDAIALHLGPISSSLKNSGVMFTPGGGHDFVMNAVWVACLLPIVFLAPNTQQIMSRFRPALDQSTDSADSKLSWLPNLKWGIFMSIIITTGLLSLTRPSEFLYFQF